ncbi:MAG: hypothetical protein OJJ54_09820 [Pseudonocardia sp.]|nr:hypothetical protein [Pseudonocardia sp.]
MSDADDLSAQLLRGMRIAQTVIVLVILAGLNTPNLVAGLGGYRAPWVGLAAIGTFVAIAVTDAVLVARHRLWGRARWPAVVVVLAVTVAVGLALQPTELTGPAHVTLGSAGWLAVLLFTGAPLRELVAVLGVHLLIVLTLLVAAGRTDGLTLVAFGTTAVAVTSFQLAVGLAGAALRSVAAQATAAAQERARTVTAAPVAAAVHADREARYAELRAVALPLLRGIGDGSRPPADADVQREAALGAARLRRMFAEGGDVADPLAAELATLIDIAEQRGVEVTYSERGPRAIPPPDVCGALLDEAGAGLLGAERTARVTLSGVDRAVVLSVVSDAAADRVTPGERHLADGSRITTVVGDGRTWVEARWAPRR